jgi:hypothetical protein
VVSHYVNFLIASAGASAAILGLLVVAVSVVNADDADPTTRENRTVLAGSAFVALVDIFLVSIVALTGGSAVISAGGYSAIRIRRSSGKSFLLAAPRDLNGPDPQLKAKFQEIRDYWAHAHGQSQTSGR